MASQNSSLAAFADEVSQTLRPESLIDRYGHFFSPPTADTPFLHLVLPYPPSANHFWRFIPGRKKPILSSDARVYFLMVRQLVAGRKAPAADRLRMTVYTYSADRRRRDLDNLFEGIQDALSHAEVYRDDCVIDQLLAARDALDIVNPRVEVVLTPISDHSIF